MPHSPPIDFSGAIDRNFPGNKDFTVTPKGLYILRDWCCDGSFEGPLVSPSFAHYTGLCPMLLAWDESESLAKDSEILRDKARHGFK